MLKNLDRFILNAVTIFVIVAYFQLFKLSVFPYSFRIIIQMIACGLMLALILLRMVYQHDRTVKMNFSILITVLILSSMPSYFVAQSYHNQSFLSSIIANHMIWFYLLYFFVNFHKVEVTFIIRILVVIGLFVVGLFYLQFFLYPRVFMDIPMLEDRGTLRLVVPGMLCTQLAYFYFLDRFFKESKFFDLLVSLVVMSIFVIQGSRQLIFAIVFLTLIMLFFSNRVRARPLKILILVLASAAVFLVFSDIFTELTRISTSQAANLGESVRVRSAKFYLTSFQPNEWSYIFGNSRAMIGGMYEQRTKLYAIKYGFYTSDIGIIGDYVRYGLVFVLTGILMLTKSIGFKISPQNRFLKYYIVMQCFTLVTGKGIFGGVDIIILLILFVFDMDRSNKNISSRDVSPA